MFLKMKNILFILLLVLSVSCSKSTVGPGLPQVDKPVPQPGTDEFVPLKGCVILNTVQHSGELENSSDTGRNLYSAEYIMDVAGVPYSVVSNFQEPELSPADFPDTASILPLPFLFSSFCL